MLWAWMSLSFGPASLCQYLLEKLLVILFWHPLLRPMVPTWLIARISGLGQPRVYLDVCSFHRCRVEELIWTDSGKLSAVTYSDLVTHLTLIEASAPSLQAQSASCDATSYK